MSVIGVGNALTDIIVDIPSAEILDRLGFPVGGMYMIDEPSHLGMLDLLAEYPHGYAAGGSAANTVNGLAKLAVKAAFAGKVGNDRTGREFAGDQSANGVDSWLEVSDDLHSGKCISMVLPGGERTMATYLGASITSSGDQLTPERLGAHKILYVEGYIVYSPLIEKAMKSAKNAGLLVALDLASYNVVEDNREYLHYLADKYVDIIFANRDEALQFTGCEPPEALDVLAARCPVVVVKVGSQGSLMAMGGEKIHMGVIDAVPRDKTGAGDLYASGFLYGLAKGLTPERCGAIGAVLSSKVIEVAGPKMDEAAWSGIRSLVARIENGEKIVPAARI